jgi:hypothetical protein
VLKTVTYRGSDNGIDIIGLRRGWEASLTSIATIRPAGAAISCHWIVRTHRRAEPCCREPHQSVEQSLTAATFWQVLLLGYSISDRTMVV